MVISKGQKWTLVLSNDTTKYLVVGRLVEIDNNRLTIANMYKTVTFSEDDITGVAQQMMADKGHMAEVIRTRYMYVDKKDAQIIRIRVAKKKKTSTIHTDKTKIILD